jgi:DNA-binding transcriptional MerR regulator
MNDTTKGRFLRSGELARLAKISSDTLRHYERKGLLKRPSRSRNGYREYPECALDRVRLIRNALAIGITLDELVEILALRDRGGAPCKQVRELTATKLTQLEARLEQLTELRNELRKLLKNWDERLEGRQQSERAGLLESIPDGLRAKRILGINGISARKSKALED